MHRAAIRLRDATTSASPHRVAFGRGEAVGLHLGEGVVVPRPRTAVGQAAHQASHAAPPLESETGHEEQARACRLDRRHQAARLASHPPISFGGGAPMSAPTNVPPTIP